MDNLSLIATASDAEAAIAASEQLPVFIYKHSPICGLSDSAILQMEAFRKDAASGFRFYQVDVVGSRRASQRIEALLGVRHESPQALLIWKSGCVWHGSHRAVHADRLRAEADAFLKSAIYRSAP